ncbi:membrane protein [Streptomyces sp. Tu 6176]|uniref:VC0807 family protein n=1 Tax=Streptomyces sp. Tu 6176 TaxID=1470557 RepID=UPI000445205A|nr:VC0807 family protein [Streptomyces sp. Tu 6176]EYT84697.1 membrane protein [Streptomyces sp. Tu 6176]
MTKTTGNHSRSTAHDDAVRNPSVLDNFRPLILDIAVPLGSYYVFKEAFGTSTFAALAWSSAVPAARTVWSLVKERRANALAALILFVNVVSLLLSFVSGDPRLMLAKDSGVSSTVAIGILVSVFLGRPMMTAGLKPFMVKGDAAKEAAWERLVSGAAAGSAVFRRKERLFSVVWGVALLAECVARVVGAYTVPVDTMVWLGTVFMVGALGAAFLVGGGLAAGPMEELVAAEAETAGAETETAGAETVEAGAVVAARAAAPGTAVTA